MRNGESTITRVPKSPLKSTPTGPDVLDVSGCAALLGTTEKAIRARVDRRQLPFRRLGGRIIFLRSELMAFLDALPGCRPTETLLDETAQSRLR